MMRPRLAASIAFLNLCAVFAQQPTGNGELLARRYREGEKITYQMKATNEERGKTLAYEVQADGVVKRDGDDFWEEFAWSNLIMNGAPVPLPPASQKLRQTLSLGPSSPKHMQMPDLSQAPVLIGPITDLLTFYADMLIAHSKGGLERAGDHFYVKFGTPSSFADGTYVILGQSSIDFDVTLTAVNRADRFAVVTVKHVPPQEPQIKIPAEWMKPPVADTPNNWIQLTRRGPDKYIAAIGKETFTAEIKLSLEDGRILHATLDNPVEVRERECSDAALTQCGDAVRYRILRKVEITSSELSGHRMGDGVFQSVVQLQPCSGNHAMPAISRSPDSSLPSLIPEQRPGCGLGRRKTS